MNQSEVKAWKVVWGRAELRSTDLVAVVMSILNSANTGVSKRFMTESKPNRPKSEIDM